MTLFTEQQIREKVKELGKQIIKDYKNKNGNVIILGVLNGSFIFIADLVREIYLPIIVDFCQVKSYNNNKQQKLVFKKKWQNKLKGKHVILVEDIVDSGNTIKFLIEKINRENPKSLAICSLLQREGSDIDVKYKGFEVKEGQFIVGYGLDNNQYKRNLKEIIIKK